jgi:exonuclease III
MLKIYSWNVNGIRAVVRKGALQDFMKKHQPDILPSKAKQKLNSMDTKSIGIRRKNQAIPARQSLQK